MPATLERTVKIDRDLARRAERKLRRYGRSFDDVFSAALSRVVSSRGMPDMFAETPSTIAFSVQGQHFVADVTPDPSGGYCAVVRGHDDCFTEGDTLEELRHALVEVTELMVFDMADKVYA